MKPLIVLLAVFIASLLATRIVTHQWQLVWGGNIAMCAMLCFTAIGHFAFSNGMAAIIPAFVPFKKELVWITGVVEIAAAILLLYPPWRATAGVFLLVFLLLILPANIYAAMHHINYETGAPDGPGLSYLWLRIPMQALFMGWIWYFAIYLPQQA